MALDLNKRVYNHKPGPCRQVKGPVYGSEDVDIIPHKNIAFITSGMVYMPDDTWNITWKGQIYKYDLSKREYSAESVKIVDLDNEDGFHPHGMSHLILEDGTIRLFIVVHTKQFQHEVVILDYDENLNILRHVKTIRDSKFIRPNDIIATGPDSFLISNDGSAQNHLANKFEVLFGFYGGSVVYFDGKVSKYLLEKIPANGISLSKDRKTLFVSLVNQEIIGVYTWNQETQDITPISEISTLTGCDNFHINEDGLLWSDPKFIAPSQILVAKFSKDYNSAQFIELLADDGKFISASSIAAAFDSNRQLLIGKVGRGLYHCDINIPIDFI